MTDKEKLALKLKLAQSRATTAQIAAPQPTPPHTPTPTDLIKGHGLGALLPLGVTRQGNLQLTMPPLAEAVLNPMGLASDVLRGKSPMWAVDERTGQTVMDPETSMRTTALATMGTPINPAVRAGDLVIPGAKTSMKRAVPTEKALKSIGNKGFEQARAMPVDFAPSALDSWSRNVEQALNERGLSDTNAPDVVKTLRKFQSAPENTVAITANNLVAFRQELQNIADGAAKGLDRQSKSEYVAATDAIGALDEFISSSGSEGVISGPAGQFRDVYTEARANRAAAFRAREVGRKQAIAEIRADVAHSGQNIGNTLRQRAADLLVKNEQTDGRFLRGWTDEEIASLKQISSGTRRINLTRRVSNMLGGGGGLGQTMIGSLGTGVGGALGGFPGAAMGSIPMFAGMGTRSLYNKMVSRGIDKLEEELLKRSPAYEKAAATVADNPRALTSLLRAALLAKPMPKPETAADIYLSAKQLRDQRNAANEKMRRRGGVR